VSGRIWSDVGLWISFLCVLVENDLKKEQMKLVYR
jgi:hypothetical protein